MVPELGSRGNTDFTSSSLTLCPRTVIWGAEDDSKRRLFLSDADIGELLVGFPSWVANLKKKANIKSRPRKKT